MSETQRAIKYRAAHYDYDGKFMRFSYWGINVPSEGINSMPASLSSTQIKGHEQYTGMKDKNGVEIFEGDVIESLKNCIYPQGVQIHSVYFEDGQFKCGNVPLIIIIDGFCPEIIGNIHTTPELLEAT